MPRAFSDDQQEHILAALHEHGYRLFASQGLRKTSVEELAAAAGISKGAFYRFFAAKEELFFALLERYEEGFKTELLAAIADQSLPPHERMRAILSRSVAAMRDEPLLTRVSRGEYELMLRRLPPATVTAHLARDDAFAESFVAAWANQGISLSLPPALVAGLIRALFFVSLHEAEFTAGSYPAVIAELTALVAARLVPNP